MVDFIGFFSELKSGSSGVFRGSIMDSLRELPGSGEAELISYLKSGIPVVDMMESEVDVISGDRHITGSSSLLTDGEWVWREDLRYYVGRYHVDLGEKFSDHARARRYKIREVSLSEIDSIIDEVKVKVLNA